MRSLHVSSRLSEIDVAINKANEVASSARDPEIQAYFARSIVIFASGVYEDCIEYLFIEFAQKYGNLGIASFFTNMLDSHFRNPAFGSLKGLLRRINPEYGNELENRLKATPGSSDALDSMVNNKNAVAHGKPATATLGDVEKFHHQILPIFDAVEEILDI